MAADLRNRSPHKATFIEQVLGMLTDAARLVDYYGELPRSAYDIEILEKQNDFELN